MSCVPVPDTEKSKSLPQLENLIKKIVDFDQKRPPFILAFGGGIIGDLAGFAAAIYRRGIPYIQIPTTLLSQVDSSIGGKVGIDLPQGKNLIGAFYQPKLVYSNVTLLKTLPLAQIREGLAEVIKYGVIADAGLFCFLEKNYKKILNLNSAALSHIIYKSALIKAKIVSLDEKETLGKRTILNFGHTIGHALEAASSYSKGYTHGQAISIGMLCACYISYKLGLTKKNLLERLEDLVDKVGLPKTICGLNLSDILRAQEHDKKFIHGTNRLVLPRYLGKVVIKENIPLGLIKAAIQIRMA
jgi:3-dehydroquinate synthase